MSETKQGFDVVGVWRACLSVWARHIVVFAALSSVAYFALKLLRGGKRAVGWLLPEASALAYAGVLIVLVLLWVTVQGFLSLLILAHFRRLSRGAALSFGECFTEARRAWGRYVLNVLMLLGLAFFGLSLSLMLIEAGRMLYVADQTNMMSLVATHLAAVIFIIAMGWYGFYFSLAPLVGAYESRGPLDAFRESRRRIRGRATGYMVALSLFGLGYMALGLGLYYGLTHAGCSPDALSWVDPVMLVLFAPLWLALWHTSYERLTQLRSETQE